MVYKTLFISTLTISLSVFGYFHFLKSPLTNAIPFNSSEWKKELSADGCSLFTNRLSMYHDLEKKHLKIGMTKMQLNELLGPATFKYNSKIKNRPGRRFVYQLGKNDLTNCYKLNVLIGVGDTISDFYLSN